MLLKLLLVAASVLLSSLAARRFGHMVGGTLAGLPMIAGPIMGFLLLQLDAADVRAIALATLVCVPATIAHLLAFAWVGMRRAWPWALLAANVAFFGVGAALMQWPVPAVATGPLAIGAVLLGGLAFPRLPLMRGGVPIPRVELACRVAAALALAWIIVRTGGVVSAAISGLLLAVPIAGNVLPCFTLPRHGAAATVALLRGFVRGFMGFCVFFVALQGLLAVWPAGAAYAMSWVIALAASLGLMGLQRLRWRPV